MKRNQFTLPLFLIALLLASLACTIFIGGPDYPAQAVPVSTEAVDSLRQQMQQAATAAAQTGTMSLQISESQLTSYLAFKLQSQDNPPFTDPQVLLRNEQMQVYGKVQSGAFQANMAIVLSVGVDAQGQPNIQVVSADFGPIPAPQGLNEAVSALIREAFTGSLGPVATGIRLQSITIADGMMTLQGRVK